MASRLTLGTAVVLFFLGVGKKLDCIPKQLLPCEPLILKLNMSSQTPRSGDKRSNSRSRTSRPTTPLRPSSRSSFRDSARGAGGTDASFPLNAFEPAFAELSDAMADLEANMMHFQLMHESLSRFTESFSSFLYGLNMNAFCVDFPEVDIIASL